MKSLIMLMVLLAGMAFGQLPKMKSHPFKWSDLGWGAMGYGPWVMEDLGKSVASMPDSVKPWYKKEGVKPTDLFPIYLDVCNYTPDGNLVMERVADLKDVYGAIMVGMEMQTKWKEFIESGAYYKNDKVMSRVHDSLSNCIKRLATKVSQRSACVAECHYRVCDWAGLQRVGGAISTCKVRDVKPESATNALDSIDCNDGEEAWVMNCHDLYREIYPNTKEHVYGN